MMRVPYARLMNLPDTTYGHAVHDTYINALQALLATDLIPVCPLVTGNLPSEQRSNNMCYILNKKVISYLEVQSILAEEQNVLEQGHGSQDHIFL